MEKINKLLNEIESSLGHYSHIGGPDAPYMTTDDETIKKNINLLRLELNKEQKPEEESIIDQCEHVWVKREDGYEEQCGPVICIICGKYNCYCSFLRSIENLPPLIQKLRKKRFEELAINGNKHQLEKETLKIGK